MMPRLELEEIPITDSTDSNVGVGECVDGEGGSGAHPPGAATAKAPSSTTSTSSVKKRSSTREKIERLVQDGAKSYPAYLKLVHTGESDCSDLSDDEQRAGRHGAAGGGRAPTTTTTATGQQRSSGTVNGHAVGGDVVNGSSGVGGVGNPSPAGVGVDVGGGHCGVNLPSSADNMFSIDESHPYHPVGGPGDGGEYNSESPTYDNAMNQAVAEATEQEKEEWRNELAKLEEDIMTLRQVLFSKEREATTLKRKLGITPISEIRSDFKQGIQNIRDSQAYKRTSDSFHNVSDKISSTEAYQKTNETFKVVGSKTASMFSSLGAFTSRKLGDARNSNAFKSFEEKMGGAYTNVKGAMSGSRSEGHIIDTADGQPSPQDGAAAADGTTEVSLSDSNTGSGRSAPLPEEKVPL